MPLIAPTVVVPAPDKSHEVLLAVVHWRVVGRPSDMVGCSEKNWVIEGFVAPGGGAGATVTSRDCDAGNVPTAPLHCKVYGVLTVGDMLLVPVVVSRETPFSVQPLVLCSDDQVRVAVWPLVMVDCDAPKKVITARGVTVTVTACWAGMVPAAPSHRKV